MDNQRRKWFITINNPHDHGFDHDNIKKVLENLKSVQFYAMCDEIGIEEQTPHTHVVICSDAPIRHSTMRNAFNNKADIEPVKSTIRDCIEYIKKEGVHVDKAETSVPDTYETYGTPPLERQGKRTDMTRIVELVEDGASNDEIRFLYPSQYMMYRSRIETIRQEQVKSNQALTRPMSVFYHQGEPNTGKSFFVRNTYGKDVYVAYADNKNLFDGYDGEPVLCIEEFTGQLPITLINGILDIYPFELPARYYSRTAQYETVIINSNIELQKLYKEELPQLFEAFSRRIHKVVQFLPDFERHEFETQEYLKSKKIKIDPTKNILLQHFKQ